MDLEEMYQVLKGASGGNGASYDEVSRWFHECQIIDGLILTEHLFDVSYERLAPNREQLSMTQFIQFIGILARETKREVDSFLDRFKTVKNGIIDEIQQRYRETNKKYIINQFLLIQQQVDVRLAQNLIFSLAYLG
ncbi:uncharacterized protein LOC114349657 [Ostrinia furnacalis]|uniref:uncharacterized protein LOC114349657 n=1 Tax=Ostrinia furnacalis TaxID=93504 RepID=UPI001040A403|nr:uncharacterized protein LOC114349657 [Ostrinia furnacalis]